MNLTNVELSRIRRATGAIINDRDNGFALVVLRGPEAGRVLFEHQSHARVVAFQLDLLARIEAGQAEPFR